MKASLLHLAGSPAGPGSGVGGSVMSPVQLRVWAAAAFAFVLKLEGASCTAIFGCVCVCECVCAYFLMLQMSHCQL